MRWKEVMIYNDPTGGAAPYANFPRADLILVSHNHSDHFEATTITAVRKTNGVIIAPFGVYNNLSAALRSNTIVLGSGPLTNNYPAGTNLLGVTVEAVPAYNANHPIGTNNAYVVTIGGRRIFISGDTGNVPEIQRLQDIDVAFLCMNTPFTMDVIAATNCIRAMRPKVVYPYHYRNSGNITTNAAAFKQFLGTDLGIEVRLRKWY
jgi:L-ascorbate metabolism protein UlaG (beta-lactamase superfamily)